jgi:hypothetical protein
MKLTLKENKEYPPIAKLIDTKNPKAVEKLVYIYDGENGLDDDEIMTAPLGHKFVPLPFVEKNQRDALFVSAPSGSGKSVFSANYLKEMRKLKEFKKKPIYLFTNSKDDDPAFSGIKNFHKVDFDNPDLGFLTVQELEGSITIWDDWTQISDKATFKILKDLIKKILETGRRLNISAIVIIHDTMGGSLTKPLIFECNSVVLYPKYSFRTASLFMKNYLGFEQKDTLSMKHKKGRYVFIRKSVPLYQITEGEVKVL